MFRKKSEPGESDKAGSLGSLAQDPSPSPAAQSHKPMWQYPRSGAEPAVRGPLAERWLGLSWCRWLGRVGRV